MTNLNGEDAGTYYYSQDALGSARTLTDTAGIVRNIHDYTAFGEPFNPLIAINQRYGFTGREHMALSGNIHYRNRNYNPMTGIFDRRDPVGYDYNPMGNLYQYVDGNPVMHTDPYGLDYLTCLGQCIEQEDPIGKVWAKLMLSLSGASIPKMWVVKLANAVGHTDTARNIMRSIPNNAYTTIPRGTFLALNGKGSAAMKMFGRAANVAWIAYGPYLAQMEVQCAAYCCGRDHYDAPGIALKFDEMAANAATSIIDYMMGNEPDM